MKELLAIVAVIAVVFMVKPGCDRRKDVTADCRKVCGDIGHAFASAVKTGFFTYKCQCKAPPKQPVKVLPQR